MKSVTAQAPGKLMLLGEHAAVYGRHCIVTAVDAAVKATVTGSDSFFFEAPDMKFSGAVAIGKRSYRKEIAFAATAVQNFYEKFGVKQPVKIATKSIRPAESKLGLGSSASVTAAVIKALSSYFNIAMREQQLFELSYKTILDVQKTGSGFDVASAVYGGTLLYKIGKPIPLTCKKMDLIICYTGFPASTTEIVRKVAEKMKTGKAYYDALFDEIEKLVMQASAAIEEGDWKKLGVLMGRNHGLLREFKVPSQKLGVSSEIIEKLIAAALDAGAYGAKLSGAGVGDCMIAIGPDKKRHAIEQALEQAGGKMVRAAANVAGVHVLEEGK